MQKLNRKLLEDNVQSAFNEDYDTHKVFGAAYWVYQQGQEPIELCFGTTAPGSEHWGLGVRVITDNTYPTLPVGAYGWSGAYGSHFWVDPTNGVAAVYMKNSLVDGGSANGSARRFEAAVWNAIG